MIEIVTIYERATEVVEVSGDLVTRVTVAQPGVPGPRGPSGTDPGALQIAQRLAEFNTEEARIAARANLGLAIIDAGEFTSGLP